MGKGAAGGAHHPGHPPKVRMDAEKSALVGALRRKGFPKWGPSDGYDWNVWWASPATVRGLFQPDTGWRLTDHQVRGRARWRRSPDHCRRPFGNGTSWTDELH